ncbi:MAG: hypothetical protein ACREDO_12255 [Methyloceanibacter sp.]
MKSRKKVIMIAVAALVAGTAALVYAQRNEAAGPGSIELAGGTGAKDKAPSEPPSLSTEAPKGGKTAPSDAAPEPSYDLSALPNPVQEMLSEVIVAAESGDIEKMRPVLESNELKPMVAATHVDDPIAFWKKESADGNGRAVLAAMLNVLSSGYLRVGKGHGEMYVWPYFAETDLGKLTPAQEVELYRVVPPDRAVAMKQNEKYSFYRLGVSPSGVWHFFIQ